uniref:Nucleolar protein 12 n=1 Tax=Schizophyllum commune (strain H4-8 / FGSC 9210) TaxID=578458 RepID=D8PXQ8_SCHCM
MSSLSSFLVPKGSKAVDSELDALFKNAVPMKPEAPQPSKTDASTSKADPSATAKADKASARISSADKKAKKRKAAEPEPEQPTPKRSKAEKKSKKQAAAVAAEDAVDDDELIPSAPTTTSTPADSAEEAENDAMDESPDSYTPPTHISATTSSNPKHPKKRTKFAPEEETPEMRDARTLFVGNVPVEVMGKKPLIKSLQRHLLSAVPNARAESIRFRSVPVPRDAIAKAAAKGRQDVRSSTNHANTRTSAWRANQNDDDDATALAKTYLTPAEKKRIAAITGDLGEKANSVTAYLVLAHPAPRPANLPPLPTADPYQAAIQIAAKMDGVEWEGRALRVDLARRDPATTIAETPVDLTALLPDPKRTLFVGNLDYGAKEDDVRAFFEAENDEEEGSEAGSDAEETETPAKPSSTTHHVSRVRIVRDSSTGVGKGFAYVQFVDRTPVDELLALPAGSLKFAKRKLRVQKCKTVPGASTKVKADKHAPGGKQAPKKPVVVPSGDPTLGSRLAGLPKDARKAAKAADAARVARRAAKKAAKKGEYPYLCSQSASLRRRMAPLIDFNNISTVYAYLHSQAHPRLPMQTPTQQRPPGSRNAKPAWQWAARWRARSVSEYGRKEVSWIAFYSG